MGAIDTVSLSEVAAAPEDDGHKKKRYGYLAWLCLGSHYLYLGRPITQLFFWVTLGGLLFWWVADFIRLPEMIRRYNRRAMEKLIADYKQSLERRVRDLEAMSPKPSFSPPASDTQLPEPISVFAEAAPPRRAGSGASALVLMSALAVAAALYVFNPPPLFPHSGTPFLTLRQVNVRALPSTASPIRAVVAKETVLSGSVEAAAAGGTAGWLKVDRGSHSGGYVAVQNLEAL